MPGSPRRKTAQPVTKSASKRSGISTKPKANPVGRPHKLHADQETLKTVENLGKIQCTTKEASAVLKVTEKTFIEFLQREKKAADAFEFGKDNGKASLRRMQLKAAEAGNVTMLIWLGKQLLGQKDRFEHAGAGGGAIEHKHDIAFVIVDPSTP